MKYVLVLIGIVTMLGLVTEKVGCAKMLNSTGEVFGGLLTWIISIGLIMLMAIGAVNVTNKDK